jgi:hypothetical protein
MLPDADPEPESEEPEPPLVPPLLEPPPDEPLVPVVGGVASVPAVGAVAPGALEEETVIEPLGSHAVKASPAATSTADRPQRAVLVRMVSFFHSMSSPQSDDDECSPLSDAHDHRRQ